MRDPVNDGDVEEHESGCGESVNAPETPTLEPTRIIAATPAAVEVHTGRRAPDPMVTLSAGVKVHPLSWHRQLPRRSGLVLGYAASSGTEIAEGVRVLGGLVGGRRDSCQPL